MRLIDADRIVYSWQIDVDGQEHDGVTLQSIIDKMPTIKLEQKKGQWIDTGSGQECSECHEIQYGYDNFRYFCAFCGADMRGEQNECKDN